MTSSLAIVDTEVFAAQWITVYDIHQRTYQLLNSKTQATKISLLQQRRSKMQKMNQSWNIWQFCHEWRENDMLDRKNQKTTDSNTVLSCIMCWRESTKQCASIFATKCWVESSSVLSLDRVLASCPTQKLWYRQGGQAAWLKIISRENTNGSCPNRNPGHAWNSEKTK